MTPELLRQIGEALFGERWQTPLAAALKVNDRTMRRWISGDSRMPPGVGTDCLRLLADRRALVGDLMRVIKQAID